MERAIIFYNVDKKITLPSAFPLSCLFTCCQTPAKGPWPPSAASPSTAIDRRIAWDKEPSPHLTAPVFPSPNLYLPPSPDGGIISGF